MPLVVEDAMTTTDTGATAPSEPVAENVTHGYHKQKDEHLKRLRRIEGQIRGLQRMVDEDTYCIDILTQLNSVNAALKAVGMGLLDAHVRHCVRESIEAGRGDEKVEELMAAVGRLAGR